MDLELQRWQHELQDISEVEEQESMPTQSPRREKVDRNIKSSRRSELTRQQQALQKPINQRNGAQTRFESKPSANFADDSCASTIYLSDVTKTSFKAAESPYPERKRKRDKPVQASWIADHHARTEHFLVPSQQNDVYDPMDDLILGSLKPAAIKKLEANNRSIIEAMRLKKQRTDAEKSRSRRDTEQDHTRRRKGSEQDHSRRRRDLEQDHSHKNKSSEPQKHRDDRDDEAKRKQKRKYAHPQEEEKADRSDKRKTSSHRIQQMMMDRQAKKTMNMYKNVQRGMNDSSSDEEY